jgi:hypothetical protein
MVGTLSEDSPTWDRRKDSDATVDTDCTATALDSYNNDVAYEEYGLYHIDSFFDVVLSPPAPEAELCDTVLALYCDDFDPQFPEDNLVAIDDDGAGYPHPRLTLPFLPSGRYFLVVTSYSNFDPFCDFQLDIEGDNCFDTDGDEVCDIDDNCPETFNPDQIDTDGDGKGDLCDETPFCGDGILQWKLGETCEPGVGNECGLNAECIDCQCIPVTQEELCGNGVINWNAGETCDPPGAQCGATPDWVCNELCQCAFVGFCGDAIIQWNNGEECEPFEGLDDCGQGKVCEGCICVPEE